MYTGWLGVDGDCFGVAVRFDTFHDSEINKNNKGTFRVRLMVEDSNISLTLVSNLLCLSFFSANWDVGFIWAFISMGYTSNTEVSLMMIIDNLVVYIYIYIYIYHSDWLITKVLKLVHATLLSNPILNFA